MVDEGAGIDPGRLYSVSQAGVLLGIGPAATWDRIRLGALPASKTADGWRVAGADLLAALGAPAGDAPAALPAPWQCPSCGVWAMVPGERCPACGRRLAPRLRRPRWGAPVWGRLRGAGDTAGRGTRNTTRAGPVRFRVRGVSLGPAPGSAREWDGSALEVEPVGGAVVTLAISRDLYARYRDAIVEAVGSGAVYWVDRDAAVTPGVPPRSIEATADRVLEAIGNRQIAAGSDAERPGRTATDG